MRNLVIILLLATTLGACKKYEEGPYVSFLPREERISNIWQIEKVSLNGEDITDDYKDNFPELVYEFNENGTARRSFKVLGVTINQTGEWRLQSDDEELNINLSDPIAEYNYIWIIKKLTQKELWVRYINGADSYEFQLVPQE